MDSSSMKTERWILRVFVGFLLIVAGASLLAGAALAQAVVATPSVPGYSPGAGGGGTFRAPAGSFSMNAANDGYVKPATVAAGSRSATIPASLRMAANAGQYAKDAMRLNPAGLIGTLALAWLLSEGMEWVNGQWMKTRQLVTTNMWQCPGPASMSSILQCLNGLPAPNNGTWTADDQGRLFKNGVHFAYWSPQGSPVTDPATAQDWDSLPDPLPHVAPELPYAPYADGAPVQSPEYAPADVPLGQPYTRPDGSTAEPRAKISPAGDGKVAIAPYEKQLTDAQGNPTPDAAPQPVQIEKPDFCQANPHSIACAQPGELNEEMPRGEFNFEFEPEASPIGSGGCPGAVDVLGHPLSFGMACDAMSYIKPIVLVAASLLAAFILVGTFREA